MGCRTGGAGAAVSGWTSSSWAGASACPCSIWDVAGDAEETADGSAMIWDECVEVGVCGAMAEGMGGGW